MINDLDDLSGEDALRVLKDLCATDAELRTRILAGAKKVLSAVDCDGVAEDVFFSLDILDVEELWDRSGPHRHGYSSPDEVAVEMIEEALRPYQDRLEQYERMGMAEQYCMGVLKGIYRFEHESQTEFKDWSPDIPAECFGGILDDWRKHCQARQDRKNMNEFISRECPEWAKWAIKREMG